MTLRLRVATVVCLTMVALSGCARPEAKKARFIAQGQKFLDAKDYSRAILAFKNAAAAVPGDAETQYQLGSAYMAAGDLARATLSFKRSTELNPAHTAAQIMLARQLARSGNAELIQDARDRVKNVLSSSPDNIGAVQTLAFTEIQSGRPEEAERQLRQALSRFPQNLTSAVSLAYLLLSRKDLDGAEAVLRGAVTQAPNSADAAVALAAFYVMTGKPADAEDQIGRALKIDGNNGSALVVLAGIQLSSGRHDEAEKTYQRASALPEYKSAYAIYLLRNGKTSQGIAELEKLVAANPADVGLRRALLSAYESAGDYPQAERLLAEALRTHANDPEALYQRGLLYLTMGRYADAQADTNSLLHRYPASPDAHYLKARVFRETGAALNRASELQQAVRYGPDLLQARLELAQDFIDSGSPKSALAILDEAPKGQHKLLPFILQRNWVLLALSDFTALSNGIAEATAAGRNPEALLQSGMMQLGLQKPAAAQPLLEEALRGNPEDLRIVRALFRCYLVGQQIPAGSAAFRQYAAQRPKSPWAQEALGEWYAATGNTAEARTAFDAAISLNPKFRPAYMMLIHLDMTEGKPAAARERLLRILAIYEIDAESHSLLARLEYEAGNTASALSQYKRAVELDPSNVNALNDLAYVLLLSGKVDEALTYAQKAAEKAPENGTVLDTLGWVLYKKGLYEGAVQELKKATAKGDSIVPRYHLAMAYVEAGDLDLGEETLETALKIDPNVPEASMARQLIAGSVRPR
jgi:tetratricopeptide (TPR) repeat protein